MSGLISVGLLVLGHFILTPQLQNVKNLNLYKILLEFYLNYIIKKYFEGIFPNKFLKSFCVYYISIKEERLDTSRV
jgi:hypothetical protein